MKIKIKKPRFGKNKEPRKKNRAKKLRHILVAAAGLVLVLSAAYIAAKTVGNVAVSNITDAFRKTFMSSSNGGWPLTVDILGIKEIKPVGGEILILSNDEAQLVTQHARTMGRVQFNASDSRTAVCNGRILAYDTAKGNVVLLSKTEKLTEISAGEKIYTACLAPNGNFAVVTGGESDAQSKITVYSSSGNAVFEWKCAGERILDASFSMNGKRIAVVASGVNNAVVYSRLVVFDIDDTKPLSEIKYDDSMMLRVCVTKTGRTVVTGDNQFVIYNKKMQRVDGLEYSENQLNSVSFDEKGNTVLAMREFGGAQTRIFRYSASGVKTAETTISGEADYVRCDGTVTAVVCGKNATKLNKNGQVTQTKTFDSVPEKVIYSSGSFFSLEENIIKKY
ncbi:MAG: WD40 repeat domain-containing protein [Clostridia bacterium]|nr:WD40 repeat domain-containing protein [Clostridia bacterium]